MIIETFTFVIYFYLSFFKIAPQVVLSDEEIEQRMRNDYQAYLGEEAAFLRSLGMAEELPTSGRIPIEAN